MSTWPWDRGRIREIKCQIPHISPPTLSTSAKVAKRGVYMRDTTVLHHGDEYSTEALSSAHEVLVGLSSQTLHNLAQMNICRLR